MKTGLLVGILVFLAGLRIFLQGHFDIMNSLILVLGAMWTTRRYFEGRAKKRRAMREEKIQQFINQDDVIDVTAESVVKEDVKSNEGN